MQHSVGYIVAFAAAVCVVCAVLVSSSAVGLKDRQIENQALDKQQNILLASGLAEPGEKLTREEVQQRFETIETIAVDVETGEVVDNPAFDPATFDVVRTADDAELGRPAPPNNAGIQRIAKTNVAYRVLDEDGAVEMLVIPVKGYGLWSTLYGFLALDKDTTTVRGITYYQHGETPGLGGEVDNPRWKALWVGRRAFDEDWEPAIEVIKGQAGSPSSDPYRVDGLSGATITSRGVSNMMTFWLGDDGFGPFLAKFRQGQS